MFQERPAGIEPACSAWKADALCQSAKGGTRRKVRESNPGTAKRGQLIARPLSGRLPSPGHHVLMVGLTFRIAKLRRQESNLRPRCLTGRSPTRTDTGPTAIKVRTAGFEPAISCSRNTRNTRLSYVLFTQERPAGVEPALPPWQGDRLPLHHGRVVVCRIVKEQEHRERLELSSPHYGCGILAAGRPVPSIASVGPEGLEPSPGGLRVRCAAANTLIPSSPFLTRREWARRESNPQSDPYKRPALTVELRAAMGEWGRKDLNLHQPD